MFFVISRGRFGLCTPPCGWCSVRSKWYDPLPLFALRVSGATLTFCCFNLLFSIRKWCDPYVSLFRFHSSDVSGATLTV